MRMLERSFSRRQIVKALLAVGASGIVLRYTSLFAADGKKIAVSKEASDPFGQFTALSRMITLRTTALEQETAKRIYALIMDEPWGPQHLADCYTKLRRRLDGHHATLTEGEQWFLSHLLTTWYLGVYYHEQRGTRRVTYRHALMWNSVGEDVPLLYHQRTRPEDWGKPPEKRHGA